MRPLILLVLCACAAHSYQDPPPAFEAASVKIAAPVVARAERTVYAWRGCTTPDPVLFRCTGATLRTLLMRAYDAKAYQIEGPAWIDTQEFDVQARVPEGARDKVGAMLQTLLAERFVIRLHKESMSLHGYELSISKGGPNLKASNAPPAMKVSMSPSGPTIEGHFTMSALANYLSSALNRNVVDATGLAESYDITLPYSEGRSGFAGGRIVELKEGATQTSESDDSSVNLFRALRTLGLKLDLKKQPTEVIVIDSANRVPIEN